MALFSFNYKSGGNIQSFHLRFSRLKQKTSKALLIHLNPLCQFIELVHISIFQHQGFFTPSEVFWKFSLPLAQCICLMRELFDHHSIEKQVIEVFVMFLEFDTN